jgi:ligand-binding SRPBCC domain-containing protein
MPRFTRTLDLAVPAATLWAFHERPDAFALLMPPWERTRVIQPPTSLAVGTRVVIRQYLGPLWVTLTAEHVALQPGHMFADRMSGGPFKMWLHRHIVEPTATGSRLTDDIEYELRGGALGDLVAGRFAAHKLDRMFAYRHEVTRRTCESMHPTA